MFQQRFGNSKIVFTETIGEHTYEEVIKSFNTAKYIYIASYGITTDVRYGNKLLSQLLTLSNVQYIKLITNIRPNDIEDYKKKLNKRVLPSNIQIFFNISNHSKIILTDKIAYIGSENYTEFSGKGANIEAGIITEDKYALNF